MRRWILVLVAGVAIFALLGFVLTYVPKLRRAANEVTCANNLKELARFAADPGVLEPDMRAKLPQQIPPATVVLPGVPPDERLSWFPAVLPLLDQRRQDTASLLAAIDLSSPWTAAKNQRAAATGFASPFVRPGLPMPFQAGSPQRPMSASRGLAPAPGPSLSRRRPLSRRREPGASATIRRLPSMP